MNNPDVTRRGFEMLFDSLNRAHRPPRIGQQADVIPLKQPVDLRVQLERALIELEDAAALVEVHYPISAMQHRRTVQRIRSLIEQA